MTSRNEDREAALYAGDALWDPSWVEGKGEATLKERSKVIDNPDFTLYSSWFCPFAQRAWIAAEECGAKVKYQWVEINPYTVDPDKPGGYTKIAMTLRQKKEKFPEFVAASPRGLVPAIECKGIHLWESMPVVEYIDAVFGGGRLVNREDPYEVARQQIWCAHCTDRIQKQYYRALVAQDKDVEEAATKEFYKECQMLAQAMKDDGPFFNGKTFSLVDIALAPFWQRIIPVGNFYFGLTFPENAEFQRLQKWWEAVKERPSVAATIVCEPRLVSTYSDYSRNVATSDAAKNYIK